MKKVDRSTLATFIGQSSFFKGLTPAACDALARYARVRVLAKRDILFSEGQLGEAVHLLLSGRVQLHKVSPDGVETVIRVVRAGEVFSEVVLLERQDYPVTAVSLSASSVALLPRQDILRLLGDARFRNAFIATMLRRQRYLADRVRYLTACDVQERFFIFVREQYGTSERIAVDLSKKDMAAAIGTTPETLSRLIQRLQSEGLIRWHGKVLSVQPTAWESFGRGRKGSAPEARFVPA